MNVASHFCNLPLFASIARPALTCLLFVSFTCAGLCGPRSSPSSFGSNTEIIVFAASSLSDAFRSIAHSFEQSHPGTRITFNFAGSQQLAQQLTHGAQADLYAAASMKHMEGVVAAGIIDNSMTRTFARNRLVVIVPVDNPAGIRSLADLATPGHKIVFAGANVPVGQYSIEFLTKASRDRTLGSDYEQKVLLNLVSYEENVKVVLSKVSQGECDAGIVYTSDVIAGTKAATHVQRIAIPDSLNVLGEYEIGLIKSSRFTRESIEFQAYVLSLAGQDILRASGFLPPPSTR